MSEFDASELRRVSVNFGTSSRVLNGLARTVVSKTLKDIERDAKRTAPRDPARPPQDPSQPVTGHLRGAIHSSGAKSSGSSIEGDVTAGANYSAYQEHGTSRIPPRPFMGPALDKNAPAFEQAMGDIAERAAGG